MRRHAKGIVAISALLLTLAWSSNIAAAATPTVTIDAPSSISYTGSISRARSIRTAAGNGGLASTTSNTASRVPRPGRRSSAACGSGAKRKGPTRYRSDPPERPRARHRVPGPAERGGRRRRQLFGGPHLSFTTLPAVAPKILAVRITALETEAEVQVEIDPGALATTYHARYGPTTALGAVSVEKLIEGEVPAKGTIAIGGLEPATTYHLELVATNAAGTAEGAEMTFRTGVAEGSGPDGCANAEVRAQQRALYLPSCRGYEWLPLRTRRAA